MSLEFRALSDMIETTSSHASLARALSFFASSNGYRYYAYLSLDGTGTSYFGNYPDAWNHLYFSEQYFNIDPVIRQARRGSGSFCWSATAWCQTSNPKINQFTQSAVAHGIQQGLTVSARASFDSQLLFSVARPTKADVHPGFEGVSDGLPALMALHYRLKQLGQFKMPFFTTPLSPRELLCLIWAAKGKTAGETAMITNLSSRTVQHYLDSAREKLGASTVAQLIALSKDLEII